MDSPSLPKTLCQFHNFTFDNDKERNAFYQSKYFLNDNTKVGHHTRYKNIYQLVSNHCLSVNNLKSERVFPRKKREELSISASKSIKKEQVEIIVDFK